MTILWPPNMKSWLNGKDPDAGKDWGPEEKGKTEDEMVGWHHRVNGHGFGWTPGVGDGRGGLACCGSWGRKESDTTEWLNWTELNDSSFSGFHHVSYAHNCSNNNDSHSYLTSQFAKGLLINYIARCPQK